MTDEEKTILRLREEIRMLKGEKTEKYPTFSQLIRSLSAKEKETIEVYEEAQNALILRWTSDFQKTKHDLSIWRNPTLEKIRNKYIHRFKKSGTGFVFYYSELLR